MSQALEEMKTRRVASGLCTALIWHGPGHQSKTFCEQVGPHTTHSAVYGEMGQYAEWTTEEAMSGFFDEPPEED